MSVLVTGAAGYIGSQFVRHLCDSGERPVAYDNLSTGARVQLADGVPLIQGDVRDHATLRAALIEHGVTDVVHFAGSISVEESVKNPALYYSNNSGATAVLMGACAEAGVKRIIFSSTAAVYGEPLTAKVAETHRTSPQSPYGHSKLLAEEIIRGGASAAGMRYGILRYFNVAGADPKGRGGQMNLESRHLVRNAIRAAKGEIAQFDVFGDDYDTRDGTGVRDFIHVADLADVHIKTLQYLREGGQSAVFNCGYGEGFTVLEVIEVVKRITGADFAVRRCPRRAGDVPVVIADPELARLSLGWTPRLNDLELIIKHAWSWEQG